MSIIIPPIVPKVPPLELEDGTAVAILYQGEAIGIVTENSDLDLSTDFYFWDETSDV